MRRRWSRRARIQLAGILGPIFVAGFRFTDALLDLPPDVEAKHELGRQFLPHRTPH